MYQALFSFITRTYMSLFVRRCITITRIGKRKGTAIVTKKDGHLP
jgi:hypothetical protein